MESKKKKPVEEMSLEELEEERRRLERIILQPVGRFKPRMYSPRVVSTETVVCRAKSDEIRTALLLIHEDGTITVKCRGECSDCEYGFPEPF